MLRAILSLLLSLLVPPAAFGQTQTQTQPPPPQPAQPAPVPVPVVRPTDLPLPPFAIDVRGFYAGLGKDEVTAAALGVAPEALPGRALGGAIGLTFYPIRKTGFALGVGGEGILARGRSQPVDAAGTPVGFEIERRLQSLSGQVSFNFGHRDGWSYVSVGMGPMLFESFAGQAPPETPPRKMTPNYGGGARWFASRHIAFCFDARFYDTKPLPTTDAYAGRERNRLFILSVGVALK
jgi:hypothetical protein